MGLAPLLASAAQLSRHLSLIGAFRTNGLGGCSIAEQCLDAWLMWGSSLRQCFLRLSSCLLLSFLHLSLLPPPPPSLDRLGVTCLSRRSRSWCPCVPSAQVQFSLGAECS